MDNDEEQCFHDSMQIYASEEFDQKVGAHTGKTNISGDLLSQYEISPLRAQQNSKYSVETVTSQSFHQGELKFQSSDSAILHKIGLLVGRDEIPSFTLPKRKENPVPNLVIMIRETFPIKEIWLKSQKKWLTTGMAIVSDSMGVSFKLMLWEKHCFLLFSLKAGRMISITNAINTHFGNEPILRLTSRSNLLNIGNVKEIHEQLTKEFCMHHDEGLYANLRRECALLMLKYPLIFEQHCATNRLLPKVQDCDIDSLVAGTVVHVRAKIATLCFPNGDKSEFKIVLEGLRNSKTCILFLHGSARSWKKKVILLRKHTWEFRFLTCCTADEIDKNELHTTILSTAECLFEEDVRANPAQYAIPIDNLTELKQILNCENSANTVILSKIYTRKVKCGVGSRSFHITSATPQHLITRLIKKSRSRGVTAAYTAECCFEDQFVGEYFLMDISSDNEVDVEKRIKALLMDICAVSATSVRSRTDSEDNIPFVMFNKFIKR